MSIGRTSSNIYFIKKARRANSGDDGIFLEGKVLHRRKTDNAMTINLSQEAPYKRQAYTTINNY